MLTVLWGVGVGGWLITLHLWAAYAIWDHFGLLWGIIALVTPVAPMGYESMRQFIVDGWTPFAIAVAVTMGVVGLIYILGMFQKLREHAR